MRSGLDHRQLEPEWMDAADVDPASLRTSLQFIRRINHWLRYNRATLAAVRSLRRDEHRRDEHCTVLDVCCGAGDLLIDLQAERFRTIGLDLHAGTLSIAREVTSSPLVRGDALALPLADRSVDIAVCSMALHHFDNARAAVLMRELSRVARHGIVVADLLRNRRAYAWIWLFTLFSRAMVRHDARSSVRAAWTTEELKLLADQAGLRSAVVHKRFGHRAVLVWQRAAGDS